MGVIFSELCKGPVVVIDDHVGEGNDLVDNLVAEIEKANLPVLSYKSLDEARNQLSSLAQTNFIIMDWRFLGGDDPEAGVFLGAEAEDANDEEVTQLVKELQKTCLAPIFIISALDKGVILAKLQSAGISTQDNKCVFVENKGSICESKEKIISTIEEWVTKSPHVYLTKAWSNEWNKKTNSVFWDLYKLNPDWPTLFYRTFKLEGDPIIALRDIIFQLIFSEMDASGIDSNYLDKDPEETENRNEYLKNLYPRLVYQKNDIEKDIRPGDVFKRDGKYYLNIRPECDTTKRAGTNPEIYLLKGEIKSPEEIISSGVYKPPFGVIDREFEITMPLLDGNPFVVFNKRKLSVDKYSVWKEHKVCRITSPFVARIRHSYTSYLGRYGIPNYPEQILESLFETLEKPHQKD